MTLLTGNPFGNFFDVAFTLASWQLLVFISSTLAFNEAISRRKFFTSEFISWHTKMAAWFPCSFVHR